MSGGNYGDRQLPTNVDGRTANLDLPDHVFSYDTQQNNSSIMQPEEHKLLNVEWRRVCLGIFEAPRTNIYHRAKSAPGWMMWKEELIWARLLRTAVDS